MNAQRSAVVRIVDFAKRARDEAEATSGGQYTSTEPTPSNRDLWFDFFDTLVSRPCVEPHDLLFGVAGALSEAGLLRQTPQHFISARISAEAALYAAAGQNEVTLLAIYQQLRTANQWSDLQIEQALQIEITVEIALSVGSRPRLAYLMASRERVRVLSDTPLPARALTAILSRHCGEQAATIPVFSSAELNSTKRSGKLFQLALERSKLQPSEVSYTGDHPHSDLAVPQGLGIRCTPVALAPVLPSEYESAAHQIEDQYRRIVGGALRALRWSGAAATLESPDLPEQAAHEAIAACGAVGLVGYVSWVLREAKNRGVTQLWFLARDGQVLARIATLLAPVLYPSATIHYVHASRVAWCLPAWPDVETANEQWLARWLRGAHPMEISMALGIEESLASWLIAAAQGQAMGGQVRDAEHLARFRQLSESARAALLAYLDERELLTGAPIMLVDVGWNGSLQAALSQILEDSGRPHHLVGAYVGLVRVPPSSHASEYLQFAPNERRINAAVIEFLCRADHGSLTGFVKTSQDGTQPVLQASPPDHGERVQAIQSYMLGYSEAIAAWMSLPGFPIADFSDWNQSFARRRLVNLCRNPSRNAALYFVRQQHDDGVGHSQKLAMAVALPRLKLWAAIVKDCAGGSGYPWFEGCIAASTQGRADFRLHFAAHRALMRALRYLPSSRQ